MYLTSFVMDWHSVRFTGLLNHCTINHSEVFELLMGGHIHKSTEEGVTAAAYKQ